MPASAHDQPREPLLATKLMPPPARGPLVTRSRLRRRLDESLQRTLTLVSAPAGFGKTTVVGDWLRAVERHAAWLALDERDNDPARFWRYVGGAFERGDPTLGDTVTRLLRDNAGLESQLTALINALVLSPTEHLLILDDYHVITAPAIHEALAFLIDHAPPNLHLILMSRADPPLPLPRLRVRRQLAEIRTDDLRFTPAEALAFLHDGMRLPITAAEVAALTDRSEGWIAALQLAALSLQGGGAPGEVIAAFGSQRYVLDYLAEEVLLRQPPETRRFLLHTSILERLSAPLCAAVLADNPDDRSALQARLMALEAANLLLTPLDQERRWYRYHQLFADFLRDHLRATQPERVPILHRRAAAWHEAHGSTAEAIGHALAGAAWDDAARLIEAHAEAAWMRGEVATVRGWIERLPDPLLSARPRLALAHAWTLLFTSGDPAAVEHRLRTVEARIDPDESPDMSGMIAAMRSMLAYSNHDLARTGEWTRIALERIPAHNIAWRGVIEISRGALAWTLDDRDAALRHLRAAAEMSRAAGNAQVTLLALRSIADIHLLTGQLHAAERLYRDALRYAAAHPALSTTHVRCNLARVLYEWNDLDGAQQLVETAAALETAVERIERNVVLALIAFGRGAIDRARALMAEAQRLAGHGSPVMDQGRIAAYRARWALEAGDHVAVEHWLQEAAITVDDPLSYVHEFDHILLARLRLAQGRAAEITSLLDRLIAAAERAGRAYSRIRLLLLRALAAAALDDSTRARESLQCALGLAAPEGYVRAFLDLGPRVADLLRDAFPHGEQGAYARQLLSAFGDGRPLHPPEAPTLLSQRELEVLRLIAAGLTNAAIAERLVVAPSTVKTHINNIFGKLAVTSRAAAVARGTALGLLHPHDPPADPPSG